MYDYSVEVKEKFIENEDGEMELNPEWVDVNPVLFSLQIDLSTANFDFEQAQTFLSPSTSTILLVIASITVSTTPSSSLFYTTIFVSSSIISSLSLFLY